MKWNAAGGLSVTRPGRRSCAAACASTPSGKWRPVGSWIILSSWSRHSLALTRQRFAAAASSFCRASAPARRNRCHSPRMLLEPPVSCTFHMGFLYRAWAGANSVRKAEGAMPSSSATSRARPVRAPWPISEWLTTTVNTPSVLRRTKSLRGNSRVPGGGGERAAGAAVGSSPCAARSKARRIRGYVPQRHSTSFRAAATSWGEGRGWRASSAAAVMICPPWQ